jgi:hypothetical protein
MRIFIRPTCVAGVGASDTAKWRCGCAQCVKDLQNKGWATSKTVKEGNKNYE